MIGFDEPSLSGNDFLCFDSHFLREAEQIKDLMNASFDVIYPDYDVTEYETPWDIIHKESTRRFKIYYK